MTLLIWLVVLPWFDLCFIRSLMMVEYRYIQPSVHYYYIVDKNYSYLYFRLLIKKCWIPPTWHFSQRAYHNLYRVASPPPTNPTLSPPPTFCQPRPRTRRWKYTCWNTDWGCVLLKSVLLLNIVIPSLKCLFYQV